MLKHVSSNDTINELKQFRDAIATSYGPHGRVALLQPIYRGHVTITSQSGKMIQLLKSSNPVLHVLYMSLQNHSQKYGDGTKMAALLTTNIILNCLSLNTPKRQTSDAINHLLTHTIEETLSSSSITNNTCCYELNWSSIESLMSVVCTSLSSHPLVTFDNEEIKHLGSLILQAFLHVITPNGHQASIHDRIHLLITLQMGHPLPTLHKGLLIEEQHSIGMDREIKLSISTHIFKRSPNGGHIIAAVYNISLNGDESDGFTSTVSLVSSTGSSGEVLLRGARREEVLKLGVNLVDDNVGIVLCQKCVHPALREYLEDNGVFVIERLGLPYINSVIDVTGGHVISTMTSSPHLLGKLTNITMVTIGNKRYILLEGISSHVSLVLPYLLEIVGDEMKSIVKSTIRTLEDLLYTPRIINGGGCGLTQLAWNISQQVDKITDIECQELLCTKRTMISVSEALCTSFHQTAASLYQNITNCIVLSDSETHHCWVFPTSPSFSFPFSFNKKCTCGRVTLSSLHSNVNWSTVSSWKGLKALLPDELKTKLADSSSTPSFSLPSSLSSPFSSSLSTSIPTSLSTSTPTSLSPPFTLSDSFTHIIAALTLSRHLSSTVLRTHSSIL